MADVAVESSVTTAVNAGVKDESPEVKEVSQDNKSDTTDAPATNGHTAANDAEQSAAKSKSAEPSAELAEEKSTKKGSKERNNAEDTKTPVKRKAKTVEKSPEEEDDEKQGSPAKKKAKKDASTNDAETEGSKEKKAAKSKPKASDDEDEDDADEEAEELKPGLLERPVVLEEGVKREKKKVQRLDLTPSAEKADSAKKVEFVEGSGEKLGELPRVEFQLQKTHADDLKPLHRLLYDKVGSAFLIKRNIRRFSGFTFSEGSTEFQKKKDKLNKFTSPMLKSICEVLDIDRGGKKEEIADRILNFLMKPYGSGKSLPSAKKRRRSSTDKSKKSKGKKSKSEKSKKKEAKGKESESDEVSDDVDDDEEEEEEKKSSADEDEGSQSESDEDSKKKKKPTKKATPAKKSVKTPTKTPKSADKSSAKKATKKQAETPKKKNTTPKKSKAESSDGSGDEDEPLSKKNSPPTDDVLRNVIKKILKTANLEEVTMKTVCKQVYDKFPEFDLTSRKDFIKTTVKQILK